VTSFIFTLHGVSEVFGKEQLLQEGYGGYITTILGTIGLYHF
jgi:hypothetical protein